MKHDDFGQRMRAYEIWKQELIQTIQDFQSWLTSHDMISPENDLRVYETVDALRKDRLTVAFVAEFSRGKTELINALFFAEYGRRLLPSEAGRTTMCPTELFYDHQDGSAYIRLLPIESRSHERSIGDFKLEPIHWTHIPLDLQNPDQIAGALHEVVKTKLVPLEKAAELGLYHPDHDNYQKRHGKPPEQVEIPIWRHAMISFPHPLLKEGLVVLDTPGLNALGNEPELTISMLPAAQAVLFLLGADTGVTRSDLDMWQHHVSGVRSRGGKGLVVVLNKIDTLWDDLKDVATIDATIESQRRASAEQLHVPIGQVFPLSAQKALLAKVRNDQELLERSRLPVLEQFLATEILPQKQNIVRDSILQEIGGLLDENRSILEAKRKGADKQCTELRSLRGKNADVIMHLMSKSREEQAAYLKNVESFQSSRRLLQNQAKVMLETLSLERLDQLIARTRKDMTGSWTTNGMKRGMKTFFDGAREVMDQVSAQAEQTRMLIRATYRKFHEEHGLPALTPKGFSVGSYSAELDRLYEEAETFRKSPVTTMTEQTFVIKKFFVSLVSHARNLFFKANQEADAWLKEVMNPLVKQIKDHKVAMEKRLETLRRISESRDTLEARIKELEKQLQDVDVQLKTLGAMRETLHRPLPGTGDTPQASAAQG
ncbi:MAG: dynamin family protein [Gammaproteobacteria bacterium]